jgi:hypothetical protein
MDEPAAGECFPGGDPEKVAAWKRVSGGGRLQICFKEIGGEDYE